MTRPEVLAGAATAMVISGVVLAVAALRGTDAPPGPPSAVATRLRRLWARTGRKTSDTRRMVTLVAAVVAGVAVWLVFRVPVAALLAAVAVRGLPWIFAIGADERRAIDRLEAVGEWVQRLNNQLSTGQGLQSAIISSVASAPQLIEPEVRRLADKLRSGVVRPDVALRQFADELDDTVSDQVVAALLLHLSDRGERLSAVLSSIAESTAKSVASRREILSKRSNARSTVLFMALFGLGVFLFVLLTEDLIEPYRTMSGQIVMAIVIASYVALLAWARKLNAPKRRPRVLAPAGREDA